MVTLLRRFCITRSSDFESKECAPFLPIRLTVRRILRWASYCAEPVHWCANVLCISRCAALIRTLRPSCQSLVGTFRREISMVSESRALKQKALTLFEYEAEQYATLREQEQGFRDQLSIVMRML